MKRSTDALIHTVVGVIFVPFAGYEALYTHALGLRLLWAFLAGFMFVSTIACVYFYRFFHKRGL